jgi:hypothetical protein
VRVDVLRLLFAFCLSMEGERSEIDPAGADGADGA